MVHASTSLEFRSGVADSKSKLRTFPFHRCESYELVVRQRGFGRATIMRHLRQIRPRLQQRSYNNIASTAEPDAARAKALQRYGRNLEVQALVVDAQIFRRKIWASTTSACTSRFLPYLCSALARAASGATVAPMLL